MKSFTPLIVSFLAVALPTLISATCSVQGFTTITFYGYPDNSPPGPAVAYGCGSRNGVASPGDGSYGNPVTMATADGEFAECEIIYVPYLKKYVRHEDSCQNCTLDWNKGIRHIDIWTGSATVNGGQNQIDCEDNLTLEPQTRTIVRYPATDYQVDSTPLYVKGASPSCRTSDTYTDDNTLAHAACST